MIEQHKDDDDGGGEPHAHPKVEGGELQNGGGAEQRRAHIPRNVGRTRKIIDEISDRKGRDGNEGELGIAVDFGFAPRSKKQHRR